ncbi:ankyrin [Xylaria telfairii]|nr:ankyrin [Xylaria telfairii]
MDPLSITASVIAIVGALRVITKGYKGIANLGKAPQEYLYLIGEIESVHAYLGMLHSVLDMGSGTLAVIDLTPVGAALSRLDHTIQKLQSALKQVEADSKTNDGQRISKIKWQIYKSNMIQLKDEVHLRKQDLVDKVGLLQLASSLLPMAHVQPKISYTRHDNPTSGKPQSTILPNNEQNNGLDAGPRRQVQRRCSAGCSCRCHRPSAVSSQLRLPSAIRQIISLVVTTAHWELMLCDDQVCRDVTQQKLALVCQIPLLRHFIWLRLAWTSVFGPGASLHLRTARVVKAGRVYDTAAIGTPQMLRYLFEERKALPCDMTPFGEGLLLTATRFDNDKVIDYLLELGADIFQPDFFGCSPALFVRYRKSYSIGYSRINSKLRILVEDSYDSKLTEYPLLDALVKGTDVELEHILDEFPLLVNEPIEFSETPLHIATRLRRYSAMELLLLRGADPRKRDVFHEAPLHVAILWNDYKAIQILLRFTSSGNFLDRRGYSPLERAIYYSSSQVISLLLSSGMGIQTDSSNALRWLGVRSPSCHDDDEEIKAIAHHLLNAGLNFDDCGGNPCDPAIRVNNYRTLRVLLNLGAQFHGPKEGEFNILYTAGNYATLNTIQVLREANIKQFDPDAKYRGWTAMSLFEYRETCRDEKLGPMKTRPTEEESIAFRALINEIRERYNNAKLVLEASNLEVGNSGIDNEVLLGEEDSKVVEKHGSLPGAWVE